MLYKKHPNCANKVLCTAVKGVEKKSTGRWCCANTGPRATSPAARRAVQYTRAEAYCIPLQRHSLVLAASRKDTSKELVATGRCEHELGWWRPGTDSQRPSGLTMVPLTVRRSGSLLWKKVGAQSPHEVRLWALPLRTWSIPPSPPPTCPLPFLVGAHHSPSSARSLCWTEG